jgi:AcrR family transcriptional regulator
VPKIVDHVKRREEIVAATWRVIDRHGLDEATTRRIAEEAGYSNGVLAHYFRDKDDILVQALTLAHAHVRARAAVALRDRTGLAALRAVVEEALPLDAERLLEARIEFSFLERARNVPRLREVHREEQAHFRARLAELVRGARAAGAVPDDVPDDDAVEQILVLVDGLSIQALLDPERISAAVQLRMLDLLLASWAALPTS